MTYPHEKEGSTRVAAMLVEDAQVQLTLSERTPEGVNLTVDTVVWRADQPLFSPESKTALAKAFRQLHAKWKLADIPVTMLISADLCVTRVVVGPTEEVRAELSELTRRCALYLTLGPGTKIGTSSIRKVDVRRDHGLVAVVNERFLYLLAGAIHDSPVHIVKIQPSAIGLCRFVGQQRIDTEEPALILNATGKGYEICISSQGSLFLDYRPAGCQDYRQIAELVGHHLARLRRYCRRVGLHENPPLERIYIAGDVAEVRSIIEAFNADGQIEAIPLTARDHDWACNLAERVPEYAALIGSCMDQDEHSTTNSDLDLLPETAKRIQRTFLERVRPWLSTVSILFILFVAARFALWRQQKEVSQMEADSQPLLVAKARFEKLFREFRECQDELTQLKRIEDQLDQPNFREMIQQITQCVPPEMNLQSLRIENETVKLHGRSSASEHVYSLLEWLRRLAWFDHCVLKGTSPLGSNVADGVSFDIECHLHERPTQKVPTREEQTGVI